MITTFLLFFFTGCWAPEVKPPEPKLSPRELSALEQSEKPQRSQPSTNPTRSSSKEPIAEEPITEESITEEIETPEPTAIKTVYPFSTTTKQEVSLMGHGGGQIMLIPVGSNIDILEKQDSRYHVICKDCSPNRPRQAGFISLDSL